MNKLITEMKSQLFDGILPMDLETMLGCIGYHIGSYEKGEIIAFEAENIRHIGIVLTGAVDMVKEDLWGNRTMLMRMRKDELFGETFACGSDSHTAVSFAVAEDARIMSMPSERVMNSCELT